MAERRYTELEKMINHLLNSCNDLGPPAPAGDSDAEREKLAQRLVQLAKAVSRQQWNEFDMRVPAEPQRDADLVLSRAAQLLRQPVPAPASDGERESVATALEEEAQWFEHGQKTAVVMRRAAALLRQSAPVAVPDTRSPECVAAWPDCCDGMYDPRCCRFPKPCSCEISPPPPVPQPPQNKEMQS